MGAYTYIVIDDEYLIRQGIIQKIKATSLDIDLVGEAEDGPEALELLRKSSSDIVLLDMKLPIGDGKQILKIIRNQYPLKKVIIISGFSDFEYTKCAIENNVVGYLLKPFSRDEIRQLLEKTIYLLEQDKLNQTKMDHIIHEKEQYQKNLYLQQLANTITNPINEKSIPYFAPEIVQMIKPSESFQMLILISNFPLSSTQLMNLLQQYADQARYIHIPIQFSPYGHLLLFCLDNKFGIKTQTVPEFSKALFRILSDQCEPESELYIGLSTVKKNLVQLHEAYIECRQAVETRKMISKKELLAFSSRHNQPTGFHWEDQEYLQFFIESGNTMRVTEYVAKFFDMLQKDPEITFLHVKTICNSLLSEAVTLIKGETLDIESQSMLDLNPMALFNLSLLHDLFLEKCLRITEIFRQKNYYTSHNLVESIQKYIQLHYYKRLGLKQISNLFFVNSSYCSYIFKEKTGENLSDYINRVRIENAKKLLKNNLYNITKVAKTVGYNNASYFFRIFKNYTGLTPWEYKKSIQDISVQ